MPCVPQLSSSFSSYFPSPPNSHPTPTSTTHTCLQFCIIDRKLLLNGSFNWTRQVWGGIIQVDFWAMSGWAMGSVPQQYCSTAPVTGHIRCGGMCFFDGGRSSHPSQGGGAFHPLGHVLLMIYDYGCNP